MTNMILTLVITDRFSCYIDFKNSNIYLNLTKQIEKKSLLIISLSN